MHYEFSPAFTEYLYNFFVDNKSDICDYCKYNVKCDKDCDCFEEFGCTAIEENTGKEYTFSSAFTCQDTEFGKCKKLEDTPCNGCFEDNTKHFEWNGKIPNDFESF